MSSPLSFRNSPAVSRRISQPYADELGSKAGSPYVALGGSPHVSSYLRQTYNYSPEQHTRFSTRAVHKTGEMAISGGDHDNYGSHDSHPVGSLPARWDSPKKPDISDGPVVIDGRNFPDSISTTDTNVQPSNIYGLQSPSITHSEAESTVGNEGGEGGAVVVPPVLKGYLRGQIANVLKAGIWWVGFSPLILALFNGNSFVVGYARIAFNLSLLLLSPIAGSIVEKVSIRKLLNISTIGRGLIYGLVLPLGWLLLSSDLLYTHSIVSSNIFIALFVVLVLIDGTIVAFANIADIDSGGTDLVASQYGIEINENLRNHFNSLHILFFDGSMVVFAPLLAGLGVLFATHVDFKNEELKASVDTMAVMGCMMVVFIVATALSLYYYTRYLPNSALPQKPQSVEEDAPPQNGSCKEIKDAIVEGFKMTWQHSRIRYRVIFFALEVALEDAMISIVIAQYADYITKDQGTNRYAYANLWAAGITAVGKIGGVITSILMNKFFTIDPEKPAGSAYRPLFYFVAAAGIAVMGIPIAFHFLDSEEQLVYQKLCVVISCFLFFLFSTVGKIGFATLMQSLAAEFQASGRVFGFLAVAVTGTDALVLMGLSALFAAFPDRLDISMWICCGIICLHGLVEFVFGPCLILGADNKKPQLSTNLLSNA